ncbi:MAG: peptidoglycan-binding protein [Parvibaculum sp.]|uniref:peptidoglycan-binding domain-containing protein n=1 Tax=Parvibaculum sp. TaxID=2024848 RepID=UPI0025CFE39A|nr:peptidoglycan-binding domain-containing protein [Parvibaculum sp.]MCE9649069.1 peptidoglycan-binding protein [Parvibaculum sp.]
MAARRGWRMARHGLWVAGVAFIWAGAELVYFVRLGYAHLRIFLADAAPAAIAPARFFSGLDLRPVARQLAVVALFAVAGYGAAAIVGPVLKNGGTRMAALPAAPAEQTADAALASDTQTVMASLGAVVPFAVPLPMPRIAHVSSVRYRQASAERASLTRSSFDGSRVPRRLMPASQTHGRGSLYASDLVSEVQIRLLRLGYPAGPPTGALNARTRRAILLFQKDAVLPVDGQADARLLRRLRETEGRNLRFAGR